MRDKMNEISDCINECMPIVVLVTWLCMVAVVIKILVSPITR